MTQAQTFTFFAADETPLTGNVFVPTGGQALSAVLIAGGLGVPQGFYKSFASWLAMRGHLVMTFDVRGIGASRQPQYQRSLKGLNADMLTWARLDFAAAVHHLASLNDGAKVALVGHSLGMHHAAMTDAVTQARISQAVSVAAGSGYWMDWALRSRLRAPVMLHLAGPLLTPLLGYFPGKRLGMVGDLPAPVMRQWSSWCRHPEFAWGAEPDKVLPSLQSARFAVSAFSFTDDEAMTKNCTEKLLAALPNTTSRLRVLSPSELGMKSIGHVGAFRREAQAALWPILESGVLGQG